MTKEEITQTISQFLAKRQKIQAVKWVVENSGLGLKQAKELVDEIEEQGNTPSASSSDDSLKTQVTALLKKKQIIEAIKLTHQTLGIGLKESKDFVEEIQKELS
ncbi:MAG: ribosomal protein L7/L12 [Verrucomicrobia bacterium]|nr:ribosomal protein L7/L12 [Cytophagales bacterium]